MPSPCEPKSPTPFRVQVLGFRVQGLGFSVDGLGGAGVSGSALADVESWKVFRRNLLRDFPPVAASLMDGLSRCDFKDELFHRIDFKDELFRRIIP